MEINQDAAIEQVVFSKEMDGKLLKIEVSKFKENNYVHFRWWYQSYDGEFLPSNEGIGFKLEVESIRVIVNNLSKMLTISDLEGILNERKNKVIS